MNDRKGPDAGSIVAGIFLILFGLCLTLLGGGCTVLWIGTVGSSGSGSSNTLYNVLPLLLFSLLTLGAGAALIWLGVKLMTGGFSK